MPRTDLEVLPHDMSSSLAHWVVGPSLPILIGSQVNVGGELKTVLQGDVGTLNTGYIA